MIQFGGLKMNPTAYLTFQGNCREAMAFYADVFGGEVSMTMPVSEMSDFEAPEGKEDWLAHAAVTIGDGEIYGSDDIMGGSEPMAGCSVMVSLPTNAEGQAAFKRLAENGNVRMPYTAMTWAAGFGMVTDKFGIQWMISTDEEPTVA
jgi:PhnB protein